MSDNRDKIIQDLAIENAQLRVNLLDAKYSIDELKKEIEELKKKVGETNG